MKRLLARLRSERGFGLIELMIATIIMNVGLLALLSAFTNGITTAKRSGRVATASTLADTQMELYRALTYGAIALDVSSVPSSGIYVTDAAYSTSEITGTCSGAVSSNPQCNASRLVTTGTGAPEGVVTAPVGSLYTFIHGDTSTTVYRKDSGTGSTGWVAIGGSNPDPDHGSYQIDTYIVWLTPTNGRAAKQVTVVVRDTQSTVGNVLARRASLFDESTGT